MNITCGSALLGIWSIAQEKILPTSSWKWRKPQSSYYQTILCTWSYHRLPVKFLFKIQKYLEEIHLKSPKFTRITNWAHDFIFHISLTCVIGWDIISHVNQSINEYNQTCYARKYQHAGEETKPGKIQAYFYAKVFSNCIQWLVFVPLTKRTPDLGKFASSRIFRKFFFKCRNVYSRVWTRRWRLFLFLNLEFFEIFLLLLMFFFTVSVHISTLKWGLRG